MLQGSVRIEDSGFDENKIGVELMKEAASEPELNSIYLTQLLHSVDHSLVLTLTVVSYTLTRNSFHQSWTWIGSIHGWIGLGWMTVTHRV